MSDLVGNPEDRFPRVAAHMAVTNLYKMYIMFLIFSDIDSDTLFNLKKCKSSPSFVYFDSVTGVNWVDLNLTITFYLFNTVYKTSNFMVTKPNYMITKHKEIKK